MEKRLGFAGELATTAMGIMPHEDVDRALDLALSVDIPFWPQLPRVSYYEDMYVQAMEHFPGEDVLSLANRLESIWSLLEAKGVDRTLIARNSMLAPATCNLLNIDKTATVDNAFMLLKELSIYLKERYL